MRADNTSHLITSAQRRHELTRAKTIQALHELAHAGDPVSFQTVAARAGVSRSWLYTQPDIKTEIQRLRVINDRRPQTRQPARQRSSETSLLRRLQIATQRNRQLSADNERLRRQLAQALGRNRRAVPTANDDPAPHNRPPRRSSVTIGPC
jgi:AraC-like DNA-binding protein